jgi:phosphoglycolate phosphatase
VKRAVLFDLDGTLLYTLGDLAYCTNEALHKYGYPVHAEEAYAWFVGDGAWNQVRRAMPPDAKEEEIRRVYEDYLALYQLHALERTHPYPGICRLLTGLKADGYMLAVVSNKPHARTREVIAHYFPDTFDAVLGHQEGAPVKPDPQIVFSALSELAIRTEDAFYVGDTATDVYTAHNSHLPCAGVLWGFRGRKELKDAGAEILCADPEELYTEIKAYFRNKPSSL